jgi:adenosylmethionine-8-amino-7-oxononanoate aminotransferase
LVQGAAGIAVAEPDAVRRVVDAAQDAGVLVIVDEIATGFGRTGTLFACERAGVVPDVMAVGKALTGGYLTMAAVLCTDAVAEQIGRGEAGVLMHGPTFMGNPLAASIACASLDLLVARDWAADVARIEDGLRAGLAPARELPGVADVRVLGAIGVVQLDHPVDVAAVTDAALDAGVWLRPFRDLVYTMPPYACEADDVAAIAAAVVAGAAAG